MKKFHTILSLATLAGASLCLLSAPARADEKPQLRAGGAAEVTLWKNPFGQCLRAGIWTPALASEDCGSERITPARLPQNILVQNEANPAQERLLARLEAPAEKNQLCTLTHRIASVSGGQ